MGEYLGTSWVGIAKGRTGKRGETAKDGKDERRKDAEREQGMIVKGLEIIRKIVSAKERLSALSQNNLNLCI